MPLPLTAQHIANQEGDFAPQTANIFTLEIADFPGNGDLIFFSLDTFPLPKEANEMKEIPWGNEIRKYAGKATVESLQLVIKDWVDQKVRKDLLAWRRQVWDPATGAIGLPSSYKKTGEVIIGASDGSLERSCKLIGLWPQSLDGGEMSMENADQVKITLVLEYDIPVWNLP